MRTKPPYQQLGLNYSSTLSKGLIDCWLFNEGSGTVVRNVGTKRNSGTLNGNPEWRQGYFNKSRIVFDGVDDHISCDNSRGFANTTFTVSCWVRSSLTGGPYFIASQQGNTTNIGGWGVYMLSDKFGAMCKGGTGANPVSRLSNTSINDLRWHHCVAIITTNTTTSASNSVTLYINGVLDQATPVTDAGATYAATTEITRIGARTNSSVASNVYNGSMDNIRIYSRALTLNEIQTLFINPFAGLVSPNRFFPFPNTVAGATIKTINSVPIANIKTFSGIPIATIRNRSGVNK